MYHPESGECHDLLVQGPCEAGQWFVLDDEAPYGASCQKIICGQNQDEVEMIPWGNECARIGETGLCQANLVLHATPYGRAMCDCPINYVWEESFDICIPDIGEKTILSLPVGCQDMYRLTQGGECQKLMVEAEPSLAQPRRITRNFRSPHGRNLVQYLRLRRLSR